MNGEERRNQIAKILTAEEPISATVLAGMFSVSRQIIVGDIALMRAAGMDIVATPRGYRLGEPAGSVRAVACIHKGEDTRRELLTMVDNGCTVIDVVVEHPLYGQIAGQLSLRSRYDVEKFMEKAGSSHPLSSLTDGVHIHHLRCPDEAAYARVCEQLGELGLLYTPEERKD